jgi:hypothetical protein
MRLQTRAFFSVLDQPDAGPGKALWACVRRDFADPESPAQIEPDFCPDFGDRLTIAFSAPRIKPGLAAREFRFRGENRGCGGKETF